MYVIKQKAKKVEIITFLAFLFNTIFIYLKLYLKQFLISLIKLSVFTGKSNFKTIFFN